MLRATSQADVMNAAPESVRARRYLLGEASEEECAIIEQEYLEREEAVEQIAAAEDDLIEDYLADQLTPAERRRFEQGYLSAPGHRVRVETVRRLIEHGARRAPAQSPQKSSAWMIKRGPWLALAASLLIGASGALWALLSVGARKVDVAANPSPQPPAPVTQEPTPRASQTAPRLFAVALAPVAVRGAADSPSIVIPSGTDAVAIRL